MLCLLNQADPGNTRDLLGLVGLTAAREGEGYGIPAGQDETVSRLRGQADGGAEARADRGLGNKLVRMLTQAGAARLQEVS